MSRLADDAMIDSSVIMRDVENEQRKATMKQLEKGPENTHDVGAGTPDPESQTAHSAEDAINGQLQELVDSISKMLQEDLQQSPDVVASGNASLLEEVLAKANAATDYVMHGQEANAPSAAEWTQDIELGLIRVWRAVKALKHQIDVVGSKIDHMEDILANEYERSYEVEQMLAKLRYIKYRLHGNYYGDNAGGSKL